MSKVIVLRQPEQCVKNNWVVTILVKPKWAFLWAVFKAVVLLRRPIRITHTFTDYPHAVHTKHSAPRSE